MQWPVVLDFTARNLRMQHAAAEEGRPRRGLRGARPFSSGGEARMGSRRVSAVALIVIRGAAMPVVCAQP